MVWSPVITTPTGSNGSTVIAAGLHLEPGGHCQADAALDLPIAGRTELDRYVPLPAETCTSSGEN